MAARTEAWTAGLAGAAVVGALQGFLQLAHPSGGFLYESVVACVAGNLLTATLLLGGGLLLAPRRVPWREPGAAFWSGWGLALAPLAANLAAGFGLPGPAPLLGGLASAVLLLAAPALGELLAPRRRSLRLALLVCGAGAPLLAFGLGRWSQRLPPPLPEEHPLAEAPEVQAGPDAPDVLLVVLTGFRADALEHVSLPALESLGAGGLRADHARAPGGGAAGGLRALLTGRDPWDPRQRSAALLPERFLEAGWRTAAVCAGRENLATLGLGAGLEKIEEIPPGSIPRRTAFLADVDRGTWMGWLLPRRLLDLLLSHPFTWGATPAGDGPADAAGRAVLRARAFWRTMTARPRPGFLLLQLDPPPPGHGWEDYLRWTRERDALLADLLRDAIAGPRPAVVLVTATDGVLLGPPGQAAARRPLAEGLLRVPFLLRGPAVLPRRLPEVFLEDAVPTILGLAGLEDPGLPGLDLMAASPDALARRIHIARDAARFAATRLPWKVLGEVGGDGAVGLRALHDLEQDPGEETDLLAAAARPEEFLAAVRRRLGGR